jgi:hypothetical protein
LEFDTPAQQTIKRPDLIRHPPDDRLVEVRLPPLACIRKSPSRPVANRGCLATKVGDASAFRARDVDFVFIKTLLSRGFR